MGVQKSSHVSRVGLLALVILLLAACAPSAPSVEGQQATETRPISTSGIPATAGGLLPLPPEPVPIGFEASDGQQLVGTYYPSRVATAPVVVLMHWVRGDENDWAVIARWLQNRGASMDALPRAAITGPWLDVMWFPEVPQGRSYGVFTFTFRGCQGGCSGFTPQAWLLDAQAAMQAAGDLPGADPMRLAAIGASVGADGAVDGCAWLTRRDGAAQCLGALSVSPGGYLGVPYADAVSMLIEGQARAGLHSETEAALCLAADEDRDSAQACESTAGNRYRAVIYSGRAHGMELMEPGREPKVLELILDFLESTVGH